MPHLPEDLLYEIFGYVVQQDPVSQPVRILRCCRLWRRIALATPSLWTQILIDQPQKHHVRRLKVWLRLSKHKPLDIHIRKCKPSYPRYNRGGYLDECFRILMKHKSRWGTLVLKDYPSRGSTRRLLSDSCFPALSALSLGMELEQGSAIEWGILRSETPKLRELELAGLVVLYNIDSWMPPLLGYKLTSLTILDHVEASLTFDEYLAVLRRCPVLERLTIEIPIKRVEALFRPPSGSIVESLNLKSMIITSKVDMERLPVFLYIQAPNLTHLGCSVPFEFVPRICALPIFPFPSLQNISLTADDYYVIPYQILESNILVTFLSQLSDLHHLALADVDFDASENIPFPFMSALTTICPHLESLSLRNCWGIRMFEWLQVLVEARRQDTNEVQRIKSLDVDCYYYKLTMEQKAWLIAHVESVRFDDE